MPPSLALVSGNAQVFTIERQLGFCTRRSLLRRRVCVRITSSSSEIRQTEFWGSEKRGGQSSLARLRHAPPPAIRAPHAGPTRAPHLAAQPLSRNPRTLASCGLPDRPRSWLRGGGSRERREDRRPGQLGEGAQGRCAGQRLGAW